MIVESLRNLVETLRNLVKIPELRTKILYTLFFLIIFRLGSHVPIPGISLEALERVKGQLSEGWGGVLVLFSTLTGGALGNCAVFSLGIMPYISASIIFSLLVKVLPSLEAIAKEGPSGYRKINEYTRIATLPLCIFQAWMIVKLLKRAQPGGEYLVDPTQAGVFFDVLAITALTVGAMFLMWLGEQITEYGIGNGASIIIMAGIVARMPYEVLLIMGGTDRGEEIQKFFILVILFIFIIASIVYMTYGQRKIAVQQAKHTRGRRVYGGQKHFLPLKVNQAGVMPVIFASSILIFPMTIFSFLGADQSVFTWGGFWYIFIYVILIYFFSYFWTSLMFQPVEMANQLQEYGSFIPGLRPGKITAIYLEKVMVRITFVGAAFLAIIALIPQILALTLSLNPGSMLISFVYNLGGTSILIVVGVILDVIQKLESHLLMRHYDGFVKRGRSRS